MPKEIPKILRFKDIKELLGISRSTLHRWEAMTDFPKRIQLGKNSVGWNGEEISQWMIKKSESRS